MHKLLEVVYNIGEMEQVSKVVRWRYAVLARLQAMRRRTHTHKHTHTHRLGLCLFNHLSLRVQRHGVEREAFVPLLCVVFPLPSVCRREEVCFLCLARGVWHFLCAIATAAASYEYCTAVKVLSVHRSPYAQQ